DDGMDQLADELEAREGPIASIPAQLVAALVPGASEDDIAVLVANVREEADALTATLPVVPEAGAVQGARSVVREQLSTWGAPEALVRDPILLVSELASNAILHGRPPIELRVRQTS